MPLDPQVARFLRAEAEATKATTEPAPSLAEQRRQSERTMLAQAGEPEAVAAVEDRLIPGPASALPIRIYTPVCDEPWTAPCAGLFSRRRLGVWKHRGA